MKLCTPRRKIIASKFQRQFIPRRKIIAVATYTAIVREVVAAMVSRRMKNIDDLRKEKSQS